MESGQSGMPLVVNLPGPMDLPASLAPLGRWGDDGIDRWDGATLLRTVRLEAGIVVPYQARVLGGVGRPGLAVTVPRWAQPQAELIEDEVRRSFAAVRADALASLLAADPQVAALVARNPAIAPVLVPDPFTALIRSISAQQVNLRWAATIRRRLAERYGERHQVGSDQVFSLSAGPLAAATIDDLRTLQLTTAKARSIIDVARAAESGELARAELAALEDEELIGRLTSLRGIGRWSAEWFLARTLGRPRVVAGDLGVRKAIGHLYGVESLPAEEQVRGLTAHWGEAAASVQAIALHELATRIDRPWPERSSVEARGC